MLRLCRLGITLPASFVCLSLSVPMLPPASASEDLNELLRSALAEADGAKGAESTDAADNEFTTQAC